MEIPSPDTGRLLRGGQRGLGPRHDWFFDQVYRSSNVFDYGVQTVSTDPVAGPGYHDRNGKPVFDTSAQIGLRTRSTVVVRRYGEAIFPVDVLVTFANGEHVREHWDGRERWMSYVYERNAKVTTVVVDPDRVLLLDVNRTNNSYDANAPTRAAAQNGC